MLINSRDATRELENYLRELEEKEQEALERRRKLEADPSAPALIRTERGVGYVFAVEAEAW